MLIRLLDLTALKPGSVNRREIAVGEFELPYAQKQPDFIMYKGQGWRYAYTAHTDNGEVWHNYRTASSLDLSDQAFRPEFKPQE